MICEFGVGNKIVGDYEYHRARRECEKPRLYRRQICREEVPYHGKDRLDRTASHAVTERLCAAAESVFHGQSDSGALGQILDRKTYREPERRHVHCVVARRSRRAERKPYGKSFGDIVQSDREEHLGVLVQFAGRSFLFFRAAVEVRDDLVEDRQYKPAYKHADRCGNERPISHIRSAVYRRYQQRPYRSRSHNARRESEEYGIYFFGYHVLEKEHERRPERRRRKYDAETDDYHCSIAHILTYRMII